MLKFEIDWPSSRAIPVAACEDECVASSRAIPVAACEDECVASPLAVGTAALSVFM